MPAPDLDMHPYFRDPEKARAILDIAIADNVARGVNLVRVVHGKGKGNFRQLIYKHLERHPDVEGFTLCDPSHGGSGATWVHLRISKTSSTHAGSKDNTEANSDVSAAENPASRERPSSSLYIRYIVYAAMLIGLFLIHANLSLFGVSLAVVAIVEASFSRKKTDLD
jgi:hypothetical protein